MNAKMWWQKFDFTQQINFYIFASKAFSIKKMAALPFFTS